MKKILVILLSCFLSMQVFSQNYQKIRQAAYNEFKQTLVAPSQFVLTNSYGNRIGLNQIKSYSRKGFITRDTICGKGRYTQTKLDCDHSEMNARKIMGKTIKFVEEIDTLNDCVKVYIQEYLPTYVVEIIGDARNRMGGYEQIRNVIYVDKNYCASFAPPTKEKIITIPGKNVIVKYTHYYYKSKYEEKFTFGGTIKQEYSFLNEN